MARCSPFLPEDLEGSNSFVLRFRGPVSGSAEADRSDDLGNLCFDLSGVSGRGRIGTREFAVEGVSVAAVYDPATKIVTLESLKANSDLLTGELTGTR